MPFTLAHPAAVIPLKLILDKYVVLSALIIGSLAPDFIYFLPLPLLRSDTHSVFALFWFCLPAGMLAYFLFQKILKDPLIALLPQAFQKRLKQNSSTPMHTSYFFISTSILLGAFTHIFWDSFTHKGSPIIESVPILKQLIFEINGYQVWTYKLLQHGSSLLGFLIILFFIWNWYQNTSPNKDVCKNSLKKNHKSLIIVILAIMPVITSTVMYLDFFPEEMNLASIQSLTGIIIKSSLSFFTIGLFSYSIIFKLLSK